MAAGKTSHRRSIIGWLEGQRERLRGFVLLFTLSSFTHGTYFLPRRRLPYSSQISMRPHLSSPFCPQELKSGSG
jgi:hypothetical protein